MRNRTLRQRRRAGSLAGGSLCVLSACYGHPALLPLVCMVMLPIAWWHAELYRLIRRAFWPLWKQIAELNIPIVVYSSVFWTVNLLLLIFFWKWTGIVDLFLNAKEHMLNVFLVSLIGVASVVIFGAMSAVFTIPFDMDSRRPFLLLSKGWKRPHAQIAKTAYVLGQQFLEEAIVFYWLSVWCVFMIIASMATLVYAVIYWPILGAGKLAWIVSLCFKPKRLVELACTLCVTLFISSAIMLVVWDQRHDRMIVCLAAMCAGTASAVFSEVLSVTLRSLQISRRALVVSCALTHASCGLKGLLGQVQRKLIDGRDFILGV